MIEFITKNFGTIIVSLILAVIIAAIIANLMKKKKSGKSTCGCGCSNCAMQGMCHRN